MGAQAASQQLQVVDRVHSADDSCYGTDGNQKGHSTNTQQVLALLPAAAAPLNCWSGCLPTWNIP
jgi:hypothetical protein